MSSDAPGSGVPGSGPVPDRASGPPATAGEWPAELVPPPAPSQWGGAETAGQGPTLPPAQPGGSQWGSPPQQPGVWAPPPGTPPAGSWNPQPASSGNGCLKACLIVGGILVVLAILGVIGIGILGASFANDIGINLDGTAKTCELVSDDDLAQVLGSDSQALPIGGIADATIGQVVLDKRVIPDAPDCWIVGASETSTTGRVARQDGGDAAGEFQGARRTAQEQGYLDGDVTGLGDEAFCTAFSEFGAAGILVRSGSSLVYVSLIDPAAFGTGTGSQDACGLAGEIASRMLR